MDTDMAGTRLRKVERQQLLCHLATLAAPDIETRAEAALQAADLMRRKGLSWQAVIPPSSDPPDSGDQAPPDWRDEVEGLLACPTLEPHDRKFLLKLAGWRAPGTEGLRRLREIIERTG